MAHGWTPIWLYQQVKIIYIITIIYKITYNYNSEQKLKHVFEYTVIAIGSC